MSSTAAAPAAFSTNIGSSPVALITGGSKGIGAAIAQRILQIGGKVCIADIDTKAGEVRHTNTDNEGTGTGTDRAALLWTALPPPLLPHRLPLVVCCLSDWLLLQALVSRIEAEFGKGKAVFVKCNVADEKEVTKRAASERQPRALPVTAACTAGDCTARSACTCG